MTDGLHVLQTATINGQPYDLAVRYDSEMSFYTLFMCKGSALSSTIDVIAGCKFNSASDLPVYDFPSYVTPLIADFNAQLSKYFGGAAVGHDTFSGQMDAFLGALRIVVTGGVPALVAQ